MVDFLIHYYRKGAPPFRSLSALPDAEALAIMRELYVEGSVFWERFQDPAGYLTLRRSVELKLYNGFRAKGGVPPQTYPIYLMLGRPKWTETAADPATLATSEEVQVPLSLFDEREISFTYPDSMVSALMVMEKNPGYYEPEYHGKVFTLQEIRQIVARRGLPGEGWETRMPKSYAHYIEAQVWNGKVLAEYLVEGRRAWAPPPR
jgi:hypothetical protein